MNFQGDLVYKGEEGPEKPRKFINMSQFIL